MKNLWFILQKGLIFTYLSPWINFALLARSKYLNISSNLFCVSKFDTAKLKTWGVCSRYIWWRGGKGYPEISIIVRKAWNLSVVTWNVKLVLLLAYISLIVRKDGSKRNSSKSLCGAKSTSIEVCVFSNSTFCCCATGISFLVHFRGDECELFNFNSWSK